MRHYPPKKERSPDGSWGRHWLSRGEQARFRAALLEQAGPNPACGDCGTRGKPLQAHHDTRTTGRLLCQSCHNRETAANQLNGDLPRSDENSVDPSRAGRLLPIPACNSPAVRRPLATFQLPSSLLSALEHERVEQLRSKDQDEPYDRQSLRTFGKVGQARERQAEHCDHVKHREKLAMVPA